MLDGPNSEGVVDPDAVSNIRAGDEAVYYGHSMCANCRVEFVGKIENKIGIYYGISFDAPIGMNDGSVDSVQYFKCEPKHGLFVKNYRLKLVSDMPPPASSGGIWSKLIKNVDVGNRVVVNGGLEGHVMTIFQWFSEERRANKPVMVGVLLEKKKGNSDGVYMGVRHFTCEFGRAIFVENFDIRPSSNRQNAPESGNLSRTNSVRSVNSMASEWRAPGAYFGGSRVTRSPGLGPRAERPGLRTQFAVRNTTSLLASRPSIAAVQADASDKREIASLKNIVEELTKEQSRVELESRQYLQQYEKKCDELLKAETELQTIRSEFEGLNFEMLEVRSLLNTLGVDSGDSGDAKNSPNLLTRTARILGLLCLHSSSSSEEEKERLCALFKMFMKVPPSFNIGSMPATISAFDSALRSAEKVVPRLITTNGSNAQNMIAGISGPTADSSAQSFSVRPPPSTAAPTPAVDISEAFSNLYVVSPQSSATSQLGSGSVLK